MYLSLSFSLSLYLSLSLYIYICIYIYIYIHTHRHITITSYFHTLAFCHRRPASPRCYADKKGVALGGVGARPCSLLRLSIERWIDCQSVILEMSVECLDES